MTLDAEVEKKILSALTKNEQGVYLALSPDIMQQIMAQLGELRKKFQELSQTPVVLTSQVIRVYLSRLIAQFYPDVYVLSFHEITSNIQIQAIGNITLQPQAAQQRVTERRRENMEQTNTAAALWDEGLAPVSREEAEKLDDRTLLQLYRRTGDQELKWTLVLRYSQLVRRIALQASGLYSSFAQLDDIIQEGLLVLLNAVDKFDPDKNVKFETYVSTRLRGMIVDLARRQDWLPRQVRQKSVRLNRAVDELSAQLGRAPESDEVAQYMGLTREQYDALLSETAVSSLVSFEAVLDSCGSATEKLMAQGEMNDPTEEQFQDKELHQVLKEGIASLRENEQMVLSLYYEKELNMKEIAQVLGVSAARVSQIHSRALQRLRVYMKQYMQA